MSRTAVIVAMGGALLLGFCTLHQPQAQTVTIVVTEETLLSLYGPGETDIYNDGLGVLSNGSFVFFEDNSPQGPAQPIADSCLLYDESINPPTGALSVIASVTDIAALMGHSVVTSSHNVQCRYLTVGGDDNVYLLLDDYVDPNHGLWIIRVPSTGGNSFAAPEVVADATRLGARSTPACRMTVDTALNLLIISLDNAVAADDVSGATVNGVFSLPASATNNLNPTLIGTMGQISAGSGGTPGIDKGTAYSLAVIPGGDIAVLDCRAGSAHQGNLLLMNRSTGDCTLWVDATTIPGTPTIGELSYNALSGHLGLFWVHGTDDFGIGDDRLEERSIIDGSLIKVIICEDEFDTLNPNNSAGHDFRLGQVYNAGLANDGVNYYIFDYNHEETIYRIPQSLETTLPVRDWQEY